jgi:hypothetical protein
MTDEPRIPWSVEGARQFGLMLIVAFGLAVIVLPVPFHVIYVVFALPTLWELRHKVAGEDDDDGL